LSRLARLESTGRIPVGRFFLLTGVPLHANSGRPGMSLDLVAATPVSVQTKVPIGFGANSARPVFNGIAVPWAKRRAPGRFYLCHPMSTQPQPSGLIEALDQVLEERKSQDPTQSYVAKLYHKGLPKILEKVQEECRETVEAASEEGTDHLVYEVGDLWFHTLVLLHHKGRTGAEVVAELARRFGVSGLTEKASRPPKEVQQ